MLRALWSASSGMLAQQMALDNISNNIANVNTHGYKKVRTEFHDLLYSQMNRTARGGINPIQVGNGVRPAATVMVFAQGNLQVTGKETDFAIAGDAFFEIVLPDGSRAYTRDGSFHIDQEGNLVTSSGYLVGLTPEGEEIKFNRGDYPLEVNPEGIILEKREVLRLGLYTFASPGDLEKVDTGIFLPTAQSGQAQLLPEDRPDDDKRPAYVAITLPNGQTAYTNELSFEVDDNGRLVTSRHGYPLTPQAAVDTELLPPGSAVTADRWGVITATVTKGRMNLFRFTNPQGLEKIGQHLYRTTENSGEPQPAVDYRITQGSLEASNVEVVEEMTEMIIAQRAYELNSRAVRTSDDMLGIANSLFRR